MRGETPSNQTVDQGILLEAGTNEVEVLVFRVRGRQYGVNVAKVREVLRLDALTRLPQMHAALDGVVRVREAVVPVVSLGRFLEGPSDSDVPEDTLLLLKFNGAQAAFRVEGVDRIHRVSWKSTVPVPKEVGMSAPVTSVILLGGTIVSLLDFESIGASTGVADRVDVNFTPVANKGASRGPIVFAEDSRMINAMLANALEQGGFHGSRGFTDGQAALDYLHALAEGETAATIRERVTGVISDIEMPKMDGFSLTKRIREHPVLKALPVILFSSLISTENEKKGKQVGATAQISKPKWDELAASCVEILGNRGD